MRKFFLSFFLLLACATRSQIVLGNLGNHEAYTHASSVSSQQNCPFCAIVGTKDHSQIILEWKDVVAIRKKRPVSGVDFLIIPKEHISNLNGTDPQKAGQLFEQMLELIQFLTKDAENKDFTLVFNNGQTANQSVFHMHMHVISRHAQSGWQYVS